MSYTEIRKRHEIVIEFIDEKKGIEYYRNADGKLVSQPMDDTDGYRSSEIAPEVSDASGAEIASLSVAPNDR